MSRETAQAVLSRCAEAGVREFCICAGARNIELVRILARAEGVRLWHFFEERSAGFFAVGRMMRTRRPVAVLTTSGTAAAELLPAVIEAHYQGLPFVALTADRPEPFRGSGAPQAIEQAGLYGDYVGYCHDVRTLADAGRCFFEWSGGPLHVNVCQDDPGQAGAVEPVIRFSDFNLPTELPKPVDVGAISLAMVGEVREADRPAVEKSLRALGAPVYAEATSGLRESDTLRPLLVRGGDRVLRALPVRRILRIGGVPSCRLWRDLEERPDVDVVSLAYTRYSGLARVSICMPFGDFQGTSDNMSVPKEKDRLAEFPDSECGLVRALSEAIPPGAAVFLGNSLPIREWNLAATVQNRGLRCFACRGANGIDGQMSAFYGMSEDEPEAWLVCGDLTAMYDLSAPWIAPQLRPGRRRVVILNNGGGRIFSRLPALSGMAADARAMIENAHGFHFDPWARMWGMDYRRVTTRSELAAAVAGTGMIEIVPDPVQSEAFWNQ